MYTNYTYQDYVAATDREKFLLVVIDDYKASTEFKQALTALSYFRGENEEIEKKRVLALQKYTVGKEGSKEKHKLGNTEIIGNRIGNNYFFRFVAQENQYLLANGVILDDDTQKDKLGKGFDKVLESMGEYALVQGVCWGFWNLDHLEPIYAAADSRSGAFALLDENSGEPSIIVQFWQLKDSKSLNIRLFEADGVTVYRRAKDGGLEAIEPKRAYKQIIRRDALGESVIGAENWGMLPVIPLFANGEKRSELTPAIKRKIDAYDTIMSDFSDNLDRANDVYWVLNNFGGSTEDIIDTLEQIRQIKAVANISDGVGGGSTAEPRTIEVPYAARQTALTILDRALYSDYMALNMDDIRGGSLTNVAIKAATANMDMKVNRYEWQVFNFVRRVLLLLGIDTDAIRFTRQTIGNDTEIIQAIYTMRSDLDVRTALKLNPYIQPEEIDGIIQNLDAETASGYSGMDALEEAIDKTE